MSAFWEKHDDPDIPSIDLLWYFHDEFGDTATLAFARWCTTLIDCDIRRAHARRLHPSQQSTVIPNAILLAQHAWRTLCQHQISRSGLLSQMARQKMAHLAKNPMMYAHFDCNDSFEFGT